MRRHLSLAILLVPLHGALAQGTADDGACRDLPQLSDAAPLAVGTITGTERTHFVKDAIERKSCPDASLECRARAYLVSGDRVLIGARRGSYLCATYLAPGDRKRTDTGRSGWLPAAAVTVAPAAAVAPEGWLGTWTRVEATIRVKPGARPGTLAVTGDATWGSLDPDRVRRGAVNLGSLEGTVTPSGDALSFAMGEKGTLPVGQGDAADCKVWMRRLGPWLVVDDNNACGGMNVSFRGLYSRAP
ncbi:hypothetical protein [Methylobacterium oryzisoli]|uniref:hypothetical protein n=1 Tax=Methylobacterium oryzisoli TaxID=3385502 RepID=UPI00389233EC